MKYMRLLARLSGQPLFIGEDKLRVITENVTIPLLLGKEIEDTAPSMSYATQKGGFATPQKVGIISVFDSLVSKNASAASGMTSYEGISAQIDSAVAAGVTDLGFYIDSPGGEVSGLFGLTSKIRGLADKGIRTFSFTDGMATSAAYAIMAATQTAYASPTALVGSIAAIMVHAETSQRDTAQGVTYTIFRSKEEKALADSKTPLSDTAKEKISSMLASMDTAFNNDVVASRPNLSVQSVVDMKGSEFMAEKGLQLGLIDGIAANMDTVMNKQFSLTSTKQKGAKMTEEEIKQLQLSLETEKTARLAAEADLEKAIAEAITGERTRCLAVIGAAKTLNLSVDTAVKHIEKGYGAEASLDMMTDIVSERTDKHAINTAIDTQETLTLDKGSDTKGNATVLKDAYLKAIGQMPTVTA